MLLLLLLPGVVIWILQAEGHKEQNLFKQTHFRRPGGVEPNNFMLEEDFTLDFHEGLQQ